MHAIEKKKPSFLQRIKMVPEEEEIFCVYPEN
jgi:hypothetical protein